MTNELLTAGEVAEWIRTTPHAVYIAAANGRIPGAVRLGRRLRFRRDEIARWIEEGASATPGCPTDTASSENASK